MGKNFFLISNLNLPSFSLEPFPLVLSLHPLVKSPSPSFLQPLQALADALRSPQSLLFSRLNSLSSLSLSLEERSECSWGKAAPAADPGWESVVGQKGRRWSTAGAGARGVETRGVPVLQLRGRSGLFCLSPLPALLSKKKVVWRLIWKKKTAANKENRKVTREFFVSAGLEVDFYVPDSAGRVLCCQGTDVARLWCVELVRAPPARGVPGLSFVPRAPVRFSARPLCWGSA